VTALPGGVRCCLLLIMCTALLRCAIRETTSPRMDVSSHHHFLGYELPRSQLLIMFATLVLRAFLKFHLCDRFEKTRRIYII